MDLRTPRGVLHSKKKEKKLRGLASTQEGREKNARWTEREKSSDLSLAAQASSNDLTHVHTQKKGTAFCFKGLAFPNINCYRSKEFEPWRSASTFFLSFPLMNWFNFKSCVYKNKISSLVSRGTNEAKCESWMDEINEIDHIQQAQLAFAISFSTPSTSAVRNIWQQQNKNSTFMHQKI
jgi:hypothetical protein